MKQVLKQLSDIRCSTCKNELKAKARRDFREVEKEYLDEIERLKILYDSCLLELRDVSREIYNLKEYINE